MVSSHLLTAEFSGNYYRNLERVTGSSVELQMLGLGVSGTLHVDKGLS